jgi:hypothetical protein
LFTICLLYAPNIRKSPAVSILREAAAGPQREGS